MPLRTDGGSPGVGVNCRDCPYQSVWYPGRTHREQCKHDLVHEDHTVEYTNPDEITASVTADGDVVVQYDEQDRLVTDGGGYCWDGDDCPHDDCGGELQHQGRFNVQCLECEALFTHHTNSTEDLLVDADRETVARKPRVMSDGGTPGVDWYCPDCGECHRTTGDPPSGRCLTCGEPTEWERRELRADGGTSSDGTERTAVLQDLDNRSGDNNQGEYTDDVDARRFVVTKDGEKIAEGVEFRTGGVCIEYIPGVKRVIYETTENLRKGVGSDANVRYIDSEDNHNE